MRALLVTLGALAGGCSLALDMERFGRGGDEKIVLDSNEPRSGTIDDRGSESADAGDAASPPNDGAAQPKTDSPEAGATAPPCTIQEHEPNNADFDAQKIGPFGTLCGSLSSDLDQDRFDFARVAPTTISIEGSQNVTVQVFRHGQIFVTHTGAGQTTKELPPGGYEIWVHGVEPGVKAYRITLE